MRSCLSRYGHYVKQTGTDIRKRKLSFCLGLSSCLVVVFVFALAQSALGVVPAVVLRLAETTNGEIDLSLSPMLGETVDYASLSDHVTSRLGSSFAYSAPRLGQP